MWPCLTHDMGQWGQTETWEIPLTHKKKNLLFSEDSEGSGPESSVSSSLGSLELKWAMAWALGDLL